MITQRKLGVVFSGLVACLGLTTALVEADVKVPKLELLDTRLDNGLRVILVPDHSAPVFAINVSYNVGSRNERPGRTGQRRRNERHNE
jgi:predicted Zn-dependent peptidase